MCPKSVWSGPVSSGSTALSVQCDETVSKQQVYEASGLQLSHFQFQGLEFETVRAVTL